MTGAHVFNVPQPYRPKDTAAEKPRTKFRWFGHALGRSSSAKTAADASPSSSRRTVSSYVPHDDVFSPPRATSKSLTSEADLSAFDAHKFDFFKRPSDTNSLRSSIASTVSTSTTHSDVLSPTHEEEHEEEDTATWVDEAHVARHYETRQWRVVRIQADGNCLFRAVSDQIYRNEAFYGDIRRRVVEYIEREKELFQPFVENEQSGRFEPIDDYCVRMKKDAEWGGNPELYAVARLFNVHIIVHQGPRRRLRIENGCDNAPDLEMHLLFRNDHYDSLHDEALLDDMPRLSTSIAMDLLENARASEVVDNQATEAEERKSEDTKSKKKKKKKVFFLGEQTRVERIELEVIEVDLYTPVHVVIHHGKVCSPEQQDNQASEHALTEGQEVAQKKDNQVTECVGQEQPQEKDNHQDECVSQKPQESQPSTDAPSTSNQGSELLVARATRVSFRKGRRVAA